MWDVSKESCYIDDLTDVSCYVSFCVDRVIADKVVKVYPNSKPWVSKSLKVLLNRKRRAFGCDKQLADVFNKFYLRFDSHDFSNVIQKIFF